MQSNDSKCGDVVYDGTQKGEYIPHSLGDDGFVKWMSTAVVQGAPIEFKATIGIPATGQLVKTEDSWVIQPATPVI